MARFQAFEDELGPGDAANRHDSQGIRPATIGVRELPVSQIDPELAGPRSSPSSSAPSGSKRRDNNDADRFEQRRSEGEWRRRVVRSLKKPWSHKQQQPSWDSARTVELHDESHDLNEERWRAALQTWLLAIGVGICCFVTYVIIEVGVGALSSSRFGYCRGKPFRPEKHCPDGDWFFWESGFLSFCASVLLGTSMAALSAWLVYRFAPAASGSGIPEVKTILNGFVLSDVLTFRTLSIKVMGLILAVASGMSLGHEGPMVHVAACWAHTLSRRLPQFQNEGKKREILSAAVAAGISSAFGTPIGGVLFSLEEVSSQFPSRTLLLAFVSSVVATLALSVADLMGTGRLALYSISYTVTFHPSEYVVFAILGITGGLVGAVFNTINIRWNAFRMTPAFKKKAHPVLEVVVVAFLTLVTSWPFIMLRALNEDTIHALFDTCSIENDFERRARFQVELGLCTTQGTYTEVEPRLLAALWGAAALRLCQMTFTIGTVCPAGLFVPSLFIGACVGRCMAGTVKTLNAGQRLFPHVVEPGVYSMVGAAAVLGGVTRMTISLVVIMLELTGGLDYVVPFMLAVLLAKAVGDSLNEGIYDLFIVLKGYPFLHEEVDVTFTERCCDIMETQLIKLDLGIQPRVSTLRQMVRDASFRGFPVVEGDHFVGYMRCKQLNIVLDDLERTRGDGYFVTLEDLKASTDLTVMRMVPDASLSQVHLVFKQLGCQHIFVVGSQAPGTQDVLLGMLSKKNFLGFLKDGHVGHRRDRADDGGRRNSDSNQELSRLASASNMQTPGSHASGRGLSVLDTALAASASAGQQAAHVDEEAEDDEEEEEAFREVNLKDSV